ncbi:hypothetical protein NI379_07175 [Vibrio parahaemolyticus]|nr:hypothetical protein NI379_07175 [Vibrio parahaemolyticus]
MSIESNHLKEFLDDVGHSVHCMNTIAVALSTITEETTAPSTLNISWKPGNAKQSSMNSRRFAVKSAIVYSVESLFEYLSKVSNSELWLNEDMNFNVKKILPTLKLTGSFDFLKLHRKWSLNGSF